MKQIITLFLLLLIGVTLFAQNENSVKTKMLKEIAERSTIIFEGKVLSKNKSFFGSTSNDNIYTSFTVEVDEILLGNITKGTVEIIVDGGQMEKDGMIYDQEFSGPGCAGYSTFFCRPVALSSGIRHTNNSPLAIIDNICYNSKGEIPPSSGGGDIDPYYIADPFININQLYKEFNEIKNITIPKTHIEKKA
jgi:hypothetical protein